MTSSNELTPTVLDVFVEGSLFGRGVVHADVCGRTRAVVTMQELVGSSSGLVRWDDIQWDVLSHTAGRIYRAGDLMEEIARRGFALKVRQVSGTEYRAQVGTAPSAVDRDLGVAVARALFDATGSAGYDRALGLGKPKPKPALRDNAPERELPIPQDAPPDTLLVRVETICGYTVLAVSIRRTEGEPAPRVGLAFSFCAPKDRAAWSRQQGFETAYSRAHGSDAVLSSGTVRAAIVQAVLDGHSYVPERLRERVRGWLERV